MERLMKRWGNNPAVPTGFDLDFIFDLDDKEYKGLQAVFDRLCELEDKIESGELVEVVRCKDCKHRYTFSSGHSVCKEHFPFPAKDDDFCSYGERREGE